LSALDNSDNSLMASLPLSWSYLLNLHTNTLTHTNISTVLQGENPAKLNEWGRSYRNPTKCTI